MKILHILNHIKNCGNGIVNVAIDLACLQARDGNDVMLVSCGGDYESLLAEYKVGHLILDQKRTPFNLVKALFHFDKCIKQFNPDIVHAHMMTGTMLSWLMPRKSSYRLIATVHNEFQKSSILMGLADRVIAVSEAVAQLMSQRGVPSHKIDVVRNGTLGSPRAKPIDCYQAQSLKRPSICTVAGMNSRKGIRELIEAFDKISSDFPSAHLYLVGDGPEREQFENIASQKISANRIHFERFQANPQRYLLATDIFVLASHKDPCPLVIPEAREASCAIVASDVDGIPELLEHGKAGILVKPGSINEIANSMRMLLADEGFLRQTQSNASLNLSCLTAARVHQETLAVYREALQLNI